MSQTKSTAPVTATKSSSKRPSKSLWQRIKDTADPDRALMGVTSACIEAVGVKRALDYDQERWSPGKPLKLLYAGYVGTRNTGADVRVEEMIRQVRHVIGDEHLEQTIMTVDPKLSAGYFRTVHQIRSPAVFPRFLAEECPKRHGVIACEGSMFKSKFASALTTFMAGALGFANAEDKLSVGYGAEAGSMTPPLQDFVRKHCAKSLVLCRNRPSRGVLGDLGVRTTFGTDTAWTFEPAPAERGRQLLLDAGWDGEAPILALCPINPFWWPVKPDLAKLAALKLGGEYKLEHYKSFYFHANSEKIDKKLDTYIQAFADATNAFMEEANIFPILVGMEQLDRRSCELLQPRLDVKAPLFISDEHNMYDMVSVLRNCSMMVSSRFHAIVTAMPGLVASGGVTMDERIRNLMNDRGHQDLFLEVDEADLGEKMLTMLRRLLRDREQIAADIGRMIPNQLALMGQMGIDFMDEVCRVYPEFPRRELPRTWEAHLPPLPPALHKLMEQYG